MERTALAYNKKKWTAEEYLHIEAFRKSENGNRQSEAYNQPKQSLALPFVELSVSLYDVNADTNLQ